MLLIPSGHKVYVKMVSALNAFLLIGTFYGCYCQDFGYDGVEGPDHWGGKYAQCLGKHQSPIDIETANVMNKTFPPLQFKEFEISLDVELENNGHTVLMKVRGKHKPTLKGGPLKGVYQFAQLHFHWGPNNTVGSENLINHQSFPLEIHLVMFNTKYKEFSDAANVEDGLAVLSFLVAVSHRDNEKYDELEDGLREVREVMSTKTLNNFVSLDHLTTMNRDKYFSYQGSLTTPPCSEVVTWIEFLNTIPLSKKQIDGFRSLSAKSGRLTHNYRPTQPINDRIIYYNSASIKKIDLLITSVLMLIIYCVNMEVK